jgi:hypothetical protein
MIARASLLFFAWTLAISHARQGIDAHLAPLAPAARPGAPEWVEVRLAQSSAPVLEGVLEIERRSIDSSEWKYRTHDLAIPAGGQAFRFLVPAGISDPARYERIWRLRWIDREGATTLLGDFEVPSGAGRERPLLIAVARHSQREPASRWDGLRIERLDPPKPDVSLPMEAFRTVPVFFDPEDMPVDPHGYMAFEAVLIEGDALSGLREKAREALRRWIYAGGRLGIVSAEEIGPGAIEWIESLGVRDPRWQPLALDATGRFQPAHHMPRVFRAEYGRLLLAREMPEPGALIEAAAWRQALGAFWGVRWQVQTRLQTEKTWARSGELVDQVERRDRISLADFFRLLSRALLPPSMRPVPAWLMWVLLAGFILAASAGEWFLLGKLRRRMLTWIVFPLSAFAVTATLLLLARHFLGSAGTQGSLVVTDLGTDDRIVRETRIEFRMLARSAAVARETQDAVDAFLPDLGNDGIGASFVRDFGVRYSGAFPLRYSTTSRARQWTPSFIRSTSLRDGEDPSAVRWGAFLAAERAGQHPSEAESEAAGGRKVHFDQAWRGAAARVERELLYAYFLAHLHASSPQRPGDIFFATSPSGSGQLDDLRCVNVGDPSTSVITAMYREGPDLRIVRRLYLHP